MSEAEGCQSKLQRCPGLSLLRWRRRIAPWSPPSLICAGGSQTVFLCLCWHTAITLNSCSNRYSINRALLSVHCDCSNPLLYLHTPMHHLSSWYGWAPWIENVMDIQLKPQPSLPCGDGLYALQGPDQSLFGEVDELWLSHLPCSHRMLYGHARQA